MDIRAILAGFAFAAMWSSAFTSARIIVTAAPPLSALALRFLLSGVLAIAIAKALGQTMRLTRQQWRATIVFGICQNALYLGLNFFAMQTVQASLAAIIASTMPLMVAFASWIVFREKLPLLGIAGLVAGIAGVAVIMGARLSSGIDGFGLLLCIVGAASLAIATLSLRTASSGGNLLMVVGLQMLVGAAALAVPAMFEDHSVAPSWPLFWAFLYTMLIPGLVATVVWFWLVGQIGATRAATFHFLNPFFGVAVAALLLGETMGPLDVLGVAVIAAGIFAVQVSRARAKARAAPGH